MPDRHATPSLATFLPRADLARLEAALERRGEVELAGCLGAMTAMHTSPCPWPTRRWLRMILEGGAPSAAGRTQVAHAAQRVFDAVGQGLVRGQVACPAAADAASCAAWALAYLRIARGNARPRGPRAHTLLQTMRVVAGAGGAAPLGPLGAHALRGSLPDLASGLFAIAHEHAIHLPSDVGWGGAGTDSWVGVCPSYSEDQGR